ncbi:MAG: HEPN domain-containing protein [Planctomycetes bacterium]|nr:HEPN domain-containing protein [Planctomycetota bacterium]
MNRILTLAEWIRGCQALRAAQILAGEGLYVDAVSRCYYAILHGAKAALCVQDVAADSHAAVRRLFGLHLVRTGEIEREWSAYLAEGLDDRLAADYDAKVSFSKEEAEKECQRSQEFLDRIRRYLSNKGFSDSELEVGHPQA